MKKYVFTALLALISSALVFAARTATEKEIIIREIVFADANGFRAVEVANICQYPQLPTGCESVAATMVLNYYGVDIKAEEFAESWLVCDGNFYRKNGKLYGPDPKKAFVGDPFSENSYGCYADVITAAVNNNCNSLTAETLNGCSIEELCKDYIDNGKPILVWATMGMAEPKKGRSWYLDDGTKFTWLSGEHCLVLVGYDSEYYFFNDPQLGSTVAYEKEISQARFEAMGSQAVYIYNIK